MREILAVVNCPRRKERRGRFVMWKIVRRLDRNERRCSWRSDYALQNWHSVGDQDHKIGESLSLAFKR